MKVTFDFENKNSTSFSQRNSIKRVVKNVVNAVNTSKYIDITPIKENFNKASYVSVTLTDDENIRIINRENRDIDKATDVLSFPYLDFSDGEFVGDVNSVEVNDSIIPFGDIVISLDTAYRQADEYGHTQEREIAFLTCHSMLHLYGYDHMTDPEFEVMNSITEELLREIGYTRIGEK